LNEIIKEIFLSKVVEKIIAKEVPILCKTMQKLDA